MSTLSINPDVRAYGSKQRHYLAIGVMHNEDKCPHLTCAYV